MRDGRGGLSPLLGWADERFTAIHMLYDFREKGEQRSRLKHLSLWFREGDDAHKADQGYWSRKPCPCRHPVVGGRGNRKLREGSQEGLDQVGV